MAKQDSAIATVLAFEKKMVTSDGYMYGTTWDEMHNSPIVPIHLVGKAVRGTISNRLKGATKTDPAKLNAKVEKPNIQTVDSASLDMTQDTLKLKFTLKILPKVEYPSSCNNEAHYKSIVAMGEKYKAKTGFKELARRYAMNIANARFLWRNRVSAEKIDVLVSTKLSADEKKWKFNAYDYPLEDFAENSEVNELANLIAEAFCGKRNYLFLEIETYALLGKGQEIYPSEELITDKSSNSKSKNLYEVNGIAAMHSQKLNNALRTIDTWYPQTDDTENLGPIAIEPYGAVTSMGKAYRAPTTKEDFYTLFDKASLGEELANEDEENYVMAVLIRGGVFGQSGKK